MIYGFYTVFFTVLGYFLVKRSFHLMQYYQQEEYDSGRFFKFLFARKFHLIDKKVSLVMVALMPLAYALDRLGIHILIISVVLLIFASSETDPLQDAKKKLALTTRVKRILALSYIIMIALIALMIRMEPIQLMPFVLIISNILLRPVESYIRHKYYSEAVDILKTLNPVIIGITGSYGKTSIKYMLKHILSAYAPTLATPGSVNTLMGITRVIREDLNADHKYFLVEMGAYGPGSIARLCDLTPPDHAIISAVGDAHYERFKSLDNVAQAKFELAQAVFSKQESSDEENMVFVNAELVDPDYIVTQTEGHESLVTILHDVQTEENLTPLKDYRAIKIEDAKQTLDGIRFKLHIPDLEEPLEILAPLYGLHQIGNIALAASLAHKLGMDPQAIASVIRSMPQIKHRLEVIRRRYGSTVIDDTYNANPIGFMSAIDLMRKFKNNTNGRAIVVTPGIVELGKAHHATHYDLGKKIALQKTDVLVVIRPERVKALIKGFEDGRKSEGQILKTFDSFMDAQKWVRDFADDNDVILYENDLPDLYERSVHL